MKNNCVICGDISSENITQNCPLAGTCSSCGLCLEDKKNDVYFTEEDVNRFENYFLEKDKKKVKGIYSKNYIDSFLNMER
jgi:hypothetical protein